MLQRQGQEQTQESYAMIAAKKRCNKECSTEESQTIQLDEIQSTLLPGLPNHLAQLCLSKLHPFLLYGTCLSWRRLIYTPCFPPFSCLYALVFKNSPDSPLVGDRCQSQSITFLCFDPISFKWLPLPSPPSNPPLCLLRRHPSFLSRIYPIQSVTASGRLVLIAANTQKCLPALDSPVVFDPLSGKWSLGPPFTAPRRWCITGSINGAIYVASGISAQFNSDVARSLERWDIVKKESEWSWEKKASLRHGRFSREAVEAVAYNDKLYMVNVKGKSAKEGAIYDTVKDQWEEMPRGMVVGWNGPGTADDEAMYAVDQEKGLLQKYNVDKDCWQGLTEPLEDLKGAEHISASRGKVCAVSANGGKIVVADVLETPPKIWTLDPPEGMEVIAIHILPRMNL